MLKDFLQYLVKSIVDNKDAVTVEEQSTEGFTSLLVAVDQADMGKIIGKEGRVIRAVRDLVRVLAVKNNLGANVILKEV